MSGVENYVGIGTGNESTVCEMCIKGKSKAKKEAWREEEKILIRK